MLDHMWQILQGSVLQGEVAKSINNKDGMDERNAVKSEQAISVAVLSSISK